VATTVFAGYAIFYAGFLQKAFSWMPLRWLGNMSYSYYLLHGLVLQGEWLILSKLRQAPFQSTLAVLILLQISLAATIGLSALLFWTVEKPFSLREPKAPRREVAANGAVPQGDGAEEMGVSGLVSSGELEKAR
jgi:peptidoglycan/LPS O-acetylase OafA/YrhL